MMFNHILGNDSVKEYLSQTVKRGMAGNSLLFAGPDGVGKSLFAEAFAKLLITQNDPVGKNRRKVESGNHPDIRIYRPEGKIGMHSIASMRNLTEEVYLAPYEADKKIFIIHEADRMLPYSANALLKTFEEPSPDTVIILLSGNPSGLLPTVLSRCRTILFRPIDEEEIAQFVIARFGKSQEEAAVLAGMAQGSIGQALKLAEKGESSLREPLIELLANGTFSGYKMLTEAAASLAEKVESGKKEMEADARKALLHGSGEDLSSAQKQSIEKEVEGVATMYAMQEAFVLFDVILSWYRDLQLISVNGDAKLFLNRDVPRLLHQAFNRGKILPLDTVQKYIADARLALQRSTSLQICLENLFLKLGFLSHS